MDEQKDPMALWVGTWTPEDAIDVEARRLSRDQDNTRDSKRQESDEGVTSRQ